jgi:hypothetical protein
MARLDKTENNMRLITALFAMLLACNAFGRSTQEYLPEAAGLDPAIPTPETILGWEVGDWHVSHDKLVHYMQSLAAASERISVRVIGHSWEQRPLIQLAITSPENQQDLESLREAHLDGNGPLVLWLGYSVHGDEPSGSNASMLVAYYLAASRSEFVRELLADSIILLDPSYNPDGLNRFASWANSNAGRQAVADPVSRQHVQQWPRGRTNHYWFDLNRDWLPLVHPESRARIVEYHRWLPHVLTDHHEQGHFSGFFFQPGVPSRQNPLTPVENLEMTRALADFHGMAMDRAGQPFFTEDAYDDFYFGKASTYPDINGSIGILFEQRAILGQAMMTSNGQETFQMAVANHLRASMSTLQGAWSLRDRLGAYQANFFDQMDQRAAKAGFAAWVVGDDNDPARARAFLETLNLHRVQYQALGESIRAGGHEFRTGQAWIIPVRQRQFGLLQALMEQRTEFEDETFYDVSAWTQPLAYNLPFATVSRLPPASADLQASSGLIPDAAAVAWIIPWRQMEARAVLQKLLDAGAKVRTSMKPFSAQSPNGLRSFGPGDLVVQAGIQSVQLMPDIAGILRDEALAGIEVHSLHSSLTPIGPDFGSVHFPIIEPLAPLIIGVEGSSGYGAGEAWFLLDQRLGIATPIVEMQRLGSIDLGQYSHLLMPDGDYSDINEATLSAITDWVKEGGILIASAEAATWSEGLCFEAQPESCTTAEEEAVSEDPVTPRAYGDFAPDMAQQVIGGAIVNSTIDLTHPLAFGFQRNELPLFRKGTTLLKPSRNAYATPVRYSESPLLAGFIGADNLKAIAGQPAVIAEKRGNGAVLRFANDALFRGFWRGTEKLFINALYFGQVIEATELPD